MRTEIEEPLDLSYRVAPLGHQSPFTIRQLPLMRAHVADLGVTLLANWCQWIRTNW